jgi:hypothetical protein
MTEQDHHKESDEVNKRNLKLVSYCGLYCPDCPLFGGKISDLARDLRKELRRVKYDKFAKYISKFPSGNKLKSFNDFYLILGDLMKFRCEQGCRLGGGAQDCAIKECNFGKNYNGCWQCSKYMICKKLDVLNSLHGTAHKKNLENIEKKGISDFVANRDW